MHLKNVESLLNELRAQGLFRAPDDSIQRTQVQKLSGESFLDAASNDYLGLAQTVNEGAEGLNLAEVPRKPIGSGASRLIFGTDPIHLELEKRCAQWLGYEECLLFSSGFAANCGVLPALISPGDVVFSDRLNHASLIDALRLTSVKPTVFPHLDLDDLEQKLANSQGATARWVVVESYYSMDGDGPDLKILHELCHRFDAHLFVDEAHSIGVFGVNGAGLCQRQGVKPDLLMCGFGKAIGSAGAVVACSQSVRALLWNKARSFIYSTAPSPLATSNLLDQIVRAQESEHLREQLLDCCQRVRKEVSALLATQTSSDDFIAPGFGPIVSLVLGSEERALTLAAYCQQAGVLVQAIRPPTVPLGESRLRITVKAQWTESQVKHLLRTLATGLQILGEDL